MTSFFGISDSFFGTNTTSTSYSGSSVLGDYAAIQNGSYRRLLNAYYSKKSSDSVESSDQTEETKSEKTNLLQTKSQADLLKKAADELKNGKLFEGTKDEETGKITYNTEEITKKLTSFVDAYNNMLDAADDVNTKSVLRKTLWMIGSTKSNSALLDKVGISIGKDNKLTVDKDKVSKADMNAMKTLFSGSGSYSAKVSGKAKEISNLSNSTLKTLSGGGSYTNRGDYNTLTTDALYNSLF